MNAATRALFLLPIAACALLAAPELAAAAEGGITVLRADGSEGLQQDPVGQSLESVSFLGYYLVWKGIAFILLLVVMAKFVLPPMLRAMDGRQKRIEDALAKAEKVNADAEALLRKHQKMMDEANAEAKRISDEAIAGGEKARNEFLEAARREAQEIVVRARNEIRLAQAKALDDLRMQAIELTLLGSQAVLETAVSPDEHRRIAEKAIGEAAKALAARTAN